MKRYLVMAVAALLLGLGIQGAVVADETRNYRGDLDGIHKVVLTNNVGSIRIEHYDGNEIQVDVYLEAQRRGIFRRRADISDVELDARKGNGVLELRIDDENVSAEWIVRLPHVNTLDVTLGVGNVRIARLADTELTVTVGVGNIDIGGQADGVGSVLAVTGVGSIASSGLEIVERNRAIVAEDIKASGRGDKPMELTVGVGKISISLN
ncbi:MAG: hypothetical protein JJU10_04260 [Idiomarina sp.]|nr:hypothetical protein [Idiomarina sp.]